MDEVGEIQAEYSGPIITGRLHPIVADRGNPVVSVKREQHGGCAIVDFRLPLMGMLDFQLFLFKLGLHFVEAFCQPADLVLRAPVDMVAGADAACRFYRCRQPHQRADDHEAVAGDGRKNGGENGENENCDER
ncbi:hypothetical protein D3C87_1746250 [compost metagenome]